ncbi:FMN-dependent NADH-azoreductase [Streptomyces spectabilis]|uniref:FMN dependent NADH:quinone oxidoreductase n=1 Tax=Streptomyces spectabilis TaxID=68270 RepID=A0A5P2XBV3_STRST|nr:NAD(P)H-dependent oxidoreductase [Streptomyces spectabilis]MBB5107836.1 FMN-dependent NADH-azoreductase [Streptomyces spectabilis]MCI3903274.1 NAD(P)H-dependent oxidoreductase [Streptomyces spectabilis]QEV60500.1 NAD(P)H dehydrogenase [Streptomyces spectabilis]GGV39013.1 FMN-dependent NADH-azoreductase [Streptomyces spectabilis]
MDEDVKAGTPVLLHLDSSADRRAGSVTRELGAAYARGWLARHPGAAYRYRDLTAEPVPLVGEGYVRLGIRAERQGAVPLEKVAALAEGAEEEREWAATLPLVTQVREATTLLVGAPMYNFSVSAALKAWIDRVSFPGAYVDPDDGRPLLAGTRVVVAAACGGGYGPGTPREGCDFQLPYLRAYFATLGVAGENLRVVRAELTRARDIPALGRFRELGERSLAGAREAMGELAESF